MTLLQKQGMHSSSIHLFLIKEAAAADRPAKLRKTSVGAAAAAQPPSASDSLQQKQSAAKASKASAAAAAAAAQQVSKLVEDPWYESDNTFLTIQQGFNKLREIKITIEELPAAFSNADVQLTGESCE